MMLYSKEGAETFFSTLAKVDMAKIAIKMCADQLITDEDLVALCSGGTFTGHRVLQIQCPMETQQPSNMVSCLCRMWPISIPLLNMPEF